MRIALVFSLLISILAVIFALQNPEMMDVQIGALVFNGTKALILIITFFIGVIVGVLGTIPSTVRSRRKVSRLRKRIADDPAPTRTSEPVREEHHHHHEARPVEREHRTSDAASSDTTTSDTRRTDTAEEPRETRTERKQKKKSKWL